MRKARGVVVAFVLGLMLVVGISPHQASAACNGHGFVNEYTEAYDWPGGEVIDVYLPGEDMSVHGNMLDNGWTYRWNGGGFIQTKDFWYFSCEGTP
ncbi:hypothetical protein J8TS2_16400 [Lederbergia ruris]|uniref:Uncharacterized protein n=1 Tax=Lederbergia ruris TaxID=217495 RepID=A0ABQ4KH80_9BACI|nr:hypothetical protein [Lederbergia ruris]GIN57321.1 hypothetical protein J8TS2_16400 [Lederbergia ruris]